ETEVAVVGRWTMRVGPRPGIERAQLGHRVTAGRGTILVVELVAELGIDVQNPNKCSVIGHGRAARALVRRVPAISQRANNPNRGLDTSVRPRSPGATTRPAGPSPAARGRGRSRPRGPGTSRIRRTARRRAARATAG